MKMLADTFVNDDHWISVDVHLPTITSATIIDTPNYSWLNEGLDENMGILNKYLTVIRFCAPLVTLQNISTTAA